MNTLDFITGVSYVMWGIMSQKVKKLKLMVDAVLDDKFKLKQKIKKYKKYTRKEPERIEINKNHFQGLGDPYICWGCGRVIKQTNILGKATGDLIGPDDNITKRCSCNRCGINYNCRPLSYGYVSYGTVINTVEVGIEYI